MSYLPAFLSFRVKCGSIIYRCTLDIMNRTGLSHYAWNPLRVRECNKSICCDLPCLDSQRDRGSFKTGKDLRWRRADFQAVRTPQMRSGEEERDRGLRSSRFRVIDR